MAKINDSPVAEKKVDQVQQILERGMFFIKWSRKYRNLYEEKFKKKDAVTFESENRTAIVTQNVLYANEGFLLLQTLFSEDKGEASFKSIMHINKKAEKEYKALLDAYSETPLKDFRDKIIAHKDRKNIGDPLTAYMNPIMDEWLGKAESFYLELNNLLQKYFDPIVNNVHDSWYNKSFEYLYKKLENDD